MSTKKRAANDTASKTIGYALERLFEDQDEDFVVDCIAPVLAWVPGRSKAESRQPFEFPIDRIVGGKTDDLTLALTWNVAALARRVPGVEAHAARLAKKTSAQREHVTELAAYGPSLVAMEVHLSLWCRSARHGISYPGATSFWWLAYRLAEADGDKRSSWDALTRARRLDPENRRFEAMSLLTGAWALSMAEADMHSARVRGRFDTAGAEVCLMYALAEIQLAQHTRATQRVARWRRAHRAAQAGLSQSDTRSLLKNLRAAEMLAAALLAGDEPTMDILYRAGLAALVVTSQPKADVVELSTQSVRTVLAA